MKAKIFILLAALVTLVLVFTSCDGIIDDAHEHTWKEATCTSPKICSNCRETEGEALGHTEETLAAQAPTCTEVGFTAGKKCSVCEKVISGVEEIPKIAHTYDNCEDTDCNVCEEPREAGAHTYDGCADTTCNVCPATREAGACVDADPKDHVCDECGETVGEHADGDDANHTCDYCNGAVEGDECHGGVATCTNKPICDECGQEYGSALGHEDTDGDYKCDNANCDVIIGENILLGNVFVPTAEANAGIFNATFGYANLTDGIISNDGGRFSTKDAASIMDATVDLKANYALSYIKLYYFFEWWSVGSENYTYVGADLKLEVLNEGVWETVFDYTFAELAQFVVSGGTVNPGDGYLEIYLQGVRAEQVRISSSAGNGTTISYYEVEIYADKSTKQDLPEINVLEGKEFIPTEAANNGIYGATLGYATLTDGVISNNSGRFSTKDAASIMDATADLKANYALSYIKLYYFFEYWHVGSQDYTYVGADLKLEVLNEGVWTPVFNYTAADLAQFVVSGGTADPGDGYLEIDLQGVRAEQVRIFSSAGNGTTISYYEIEIFADKASAK